MQQAAFALQVGARPHANGSSSSFLIELLLQHGRSWVAFLEAAPLVRPGSLALPISF